MDCQSADCQAIECQEMECRSMECQAMECRAMECRVMESDYSPQPQDGTVRMTKLDQYVLIMQPVMRDICPLYLPVILSFNLREWVYCQYLFVT